MFLFFSCKSDGLSKTDKELIETQLYIYNSRAKSNYNIGLIQAETDARIKYMNYDLEDSLVKLSVEIFKSDYNSPYEFKKDTAKTLESYLAYCKAHGYDPKEYIEYLEEK